MHTVGLFNSKSERPWKRHADRYATPSDRVYARLLGLTHPPMILRKKNIPPITKARMEKIRAAFIDPSIAVDP